MNASAQDQEYYFVPLGRERGGYLDFLGLPANASEGQAKERETQYRARIELEKRIKMTTLTTSVTYRELLAKHHKGEVPTDQLQARIDKIRSRFIDSNKSLRKLDVRLKRKELDQQAYDAELDDLAAAFDALQTDPTNITREEADAQLAQLEKDENEKLEHLNRLNQDYQVILAKRRELRQRGLTDDSAAWIEIYPPSEHEDERRQLWQRALEPRPLPQKLHMGAQAIPVTSLVALRHLVNYYMARHLHAADKLWSGVRGTNRTLWQAKLDHWAGEIQSLGPHFSLELSGAPRPAADFPALYAPTSLVIDQLEHDQGEELDHGPRRGGTATRQHLAAMLEELLRAASFPEEESAAAASQPSTEADLRSK